MDQEQQQNWYVVIGGERQGPLSQSALIDRLRAGDLELNTLVWRPGMSEWVPASQVADLSRQIPPPLPISRVVPPPVPAAAVAERPTGHTTAEPLPWERAEAEARPENVRASEPVHEERDTNFSGESRPWVRYWARSIDSLLWAMAFGVLLELLFPAWLAGTPDFVLGLLLLASWAFVEPAVMTAFGNTPGKALLRTQIVQPEEDLSYGLLQNRALSVWIGGLGFGLPLISLFTLASAYRRLESHGITTWDEDLGVRVIHRPIGALRIIAAVALMAFFFVIMVVWGSP